MSVSMNLSVMDRILLLNILPKEGNMQTLILLRELKEELVFSEDENRDLNVRMEGEMLFWNKDAEIPKKVVFGDTMKQIISDSFKVLDSESKLNENMIDLFNQFV